MTRREISPLLDLNAVLPCWEKYSDALREGRVRRPRAARWHRRDRGKRSTVFHRPRRWPPNAAYWQQLYSRAAS